jgi:hypothetical protein
MREKVSYSNQKKFFIRTNSIYEKDRFYCQIVTFEMEVSLRYYLDFIMSGKVDSTSKRF